MFCPLCKSEFRDGFTECSDCHIPLVATKEEAESTPVERLWAGASSEVATPILSALDDAGIPSMSKEVILKKPMSWLSVIFFQFMQPAPRFETRIWVLRSDFAKAKQVLTSVLPPISEDDDSDPSADAA
jgi:hypothetical protein